MARKRVEAVRPPWVVVCGAVILTVCLLAGTAGNAREYMVECDTNYAICGGSNLPDSCDNTGYMINEIQDSLSNWGLINYWAEQDAWPQDWSDPAVLAGSDDDVTMDGIGIGDLAVWSGHGTGGNEPDGTWSLATGHGHDGVCDATSPNSMKFGEQFDDGFGNDGDNEYIIMDASCSAVEGELAQVWQNWGPGILMRSHQGMAFHDSPDDVDDRLEDFIENIDDGDSNRTAWLDAGENCSFWSCWNSPLIITFGADEADASSRHSGETMRSPRGDAPSGWGGWYKWSKIDNGSC